MSDSLWPHGLQHARLPSPSSTPGACSNLCPLSRWCDPTVSSSDVPFSSFPQSLPAAGSFPMSQFFTSGGQSIGASASPPVLPMNTQNWSPLGWTGWISLQSKGLSRVFSSAPVGACPFLPLLDRESCGGIPIWLSPSAESRACGLVSAWSVTQSYPTLCDLLDCSPPCSSVHGIF